MLHNATYLGTEKHEKNTEEFYCEHCLFSTSHKGMWNRHIKTKKHNATQMLQNATSLGTEKHENYWHCDCGKTYSHHSSYYRHKAMCKYEPPTEPPTEPHVEPVANIQNKIVSQDKDQVIQDLLKQNAEQIKVIIDLVQRVGNNNNFNSHNTNIILQLNSNYPNALPIQYLIDQIKGNPKCVTHDPKLYAQAFIEALSQQTDDERTIRAIKDTMYVKYEEAGFKEDKEVEVFDIVKKGTELDQLGKAAQENSNMFSREKDSKEYPELVSGIMKPLTPCERKQIKKQIIKTIGSE